MDNKDIEKIGRLREEIIFSPDSEVRLTGAEFAKEQEKQMIVEFEKEAKKRDREDEFKSADRD